MFLGKRVHQGLEIFYRHRQFGIQLEPDDVVRRMNDSWDAVVADEDVTFKSAADAESLKAKAGDLVAVFRGKEWGDVLMVPFYDLPGRISCLLCVGRQGDPEQDYVIKRANRGGRGTPTEFRWCSTLDTDFSVGIGASCSSSGMNGEIVSWAWTGATAGSWRCSAPKAGIAAVFPGSTATAPQPARFRTWNGHCGGNEGGMTR